MKLETLKIPIPMIQYQEGFSVWCWSVNTIKQINETDLEIVKNLLSDEEMATCLELINNTQIQVVNSLPTNVPYQVAFDLNVRVLLILENSIGCFAVIQDVPREQWQMFFSWADRDGVFDKDKSELILAASRNDIETVQTILTKGTNININTKSPMGMTALMYAALHGYKEIVKLLINHGASVKISGNEVVPMQAAVLGGYEIAKIFIDMGSEINVKNRYGQTPLMIAACSSKERTEDLVKLLLDKGADPNVISYLGLTALDFAIGYNRKKIVKLLNQSINNLK